MADRYLYLVIDLCCIVVPFLASFHPAIQFYKQWRAFLPASVATAIFFIIWDVVFTQWGVWNFNSRYLIGYRFMNLPIEEVGFFICIPYACTFTFYCFSKFVKRGFNLNTFTTISYALAVILFATALFHTEQLYTSVTFILVAALLMLLVMRKASFLPIFYIAFVVTLIPFFISNGILTGSWIAEPVVRYNDTYNLHIRLGTIPVEDVFYGMLLQLMNVAGYMYLMGRREEANA